MANLAHLGSTNIAETVMSLAAATPLLGVVPLLIAAAFVLVRRIRKPIVRPIIRTDLNVAARILCDLCFENQVDSAPVGPCMHYYCTTCLRRHATAKAELQQQPILCPADGCHTTIDYDACVKLGLAPVLLEKLAEGEVFTAVSDDQRLWCPNAQCSRLLTVDGSNQCGDVRCPDCQQSICMLCKGKGHGGESCARARVKQRTRQKREEGTAALKWTVLAKGWQQCSKCGVVIERTVGCNHMTCTCGYQFCYVCGGSWEKLPHRCGVMKRVRARLYRAMATTVSWVPSFSSARDA